MRRLILLLLVLIISGCTIPTEPNHPQTIIFFEPFGYNDFFLAHSPIPRINYDGVFVSQFHKYDYLDSAGKDTTSFLYDSHATLYNKLGNIIGIPSDSLSVQVNGVKLPFKRYYDYDTNLQLNFLLPVSWALSGDSYFPSFTQTTSSETHIDISSPAPKDSLFENAGFDLAYNAPGADSVTITLEYDGMGISESDTTNQVSEYFDYHHILIANSTHYTVPAYILDTSFLKTFTPQSVGVAVAWAQGDTIHIAGKVFGFVTEAITSRYYYFKQ